MVSFIPQGHLAMYRAKICQKLIWCQCLPYISLLDTGLTARKSSETCFFLSFYKLFLSQTSITWHLLKAFKTFDLLSFISVKWYILEMLLEKKNNPEK